MIARDDRNAAEHEWINDRRGTGGDGERADEHGADQADRVGLENVRRHARAIADVVAHVVRDRRRIARIVFVEICSILPTRSAPTSAAFV